MLAQVRMATSVHQNFPPHTPISARRRAASSLGESSSSSSSSSSAPALPATPFSAGTTPSSTTTSPSSASSPSSSASSSSPSTATNPTTTTTSNDSIPDPWPGTPGLHHNPPPPDTSNGWARWPSWLSWKPTSPDQLAEAESRMLSAISTPYHQEFVQVDEDGNCVNTIRLGSGPPLVLVHGMGGGIGIWVANLDKLAEHFTVYAVDLVGWGRSSRPTLPKDVAADQEAAVAWYTGHIEAWRKAVGLESFALAGHSMGGFLSIEYAMRYQGRVNHLIPFDPWGFPTEPEEFNFKPPLMWRILFPILQRQPVLAGVRFLGPFGPGAITRMRSDFTRRFAKVYGEDSPNILDYIYHCAAQYPSGEMAFQSMYTPRVFSKVPLGNGRMADDMPGGLVTDMKISFVYGKKSWMDPAIGFKEANGLKERGFEVRFYGVEDAAHHLYVDNPDHVNAILIGTVSGRHHEVVHHEWEPPANTDPFASRGRRGRGSTSSSGSSSSDNSGSGSSDEKGNRV